MLKRERNLQTGLKDRISQLKSRLEESLIEHESSDLDGIMNQLKSHIFLKEKSLNDPKLKTNKNFSKSQNCQLHDHFKDKDMNKENEARMSQQIEIPPNKFSSSKK